MNKRKIVHWKVPLEFNDWIEVRKNNIERVARNFGKNTKLTKTDVMRLIAKTEGIEINDYLLKQLKNKNVKNKK